MSEGIQETHGRRHRTVETKLRRAWHKERRFFHSRGLCHLLVWAVALIVLDLLVDWMFDVPGTGRPVLLAINVGALGWVAYWRWVRHLRRFDAARVALQVEDRHPELRSLLISYIQLGGRQDEYVSPALVAAMRRQAVQVADPMDFREIVNYRELKRIFLFSMVVILGFAVGSVNWAEYFRTLAYRMLTGSNVKYPTRTQIHSLTSDLTLRQGESVTVAAHAFGRVPARGTLHYKPQNAGWQKLPLARQGEREFAHPFNELYEGFEYYFEIGDAKSSKYRVTVVPPPRIVKALIQLAYPPYTKLGEKEIADQLTLEDRVPEGTRIRWQVWCDPPVATAEMFLARDGGRGEPNDMRLDPAGVRAEASLVLDARDELRYWFRWSTREPNYVHEEDVEHTIKVKPDNRPEVELFQPARPLTDDGIIKATIYKTATLTYRADDDYAIDKAWIIYRVNGGEEKELEIPAPTRGALEKHVWPLKLKLPDLKVEDELTFYLKVCDNYPGEPSPTSGESAGPHYARSMTRTFKIVSVAEYRKYILENLANLTETIREDHRSETEASDAVKTLPGEETSTAPSSQPARSGEGERKP